MLSCFVIIQMDHLLFWLGISTQYANLDTVSAILSGIPIPAIKLANRLGLCSRSCCTVRAKTASALLGVIVETLAYDSDSGVELLSSTTYVDLLVIRIPT